jgi:hypothetical protein
MHKSIGQVLQGPSRPVMSPFLPMFQRNSVPIHLSSKPEVPPRQTRLCLASRCQTLLKKTNEKRDNPSKQTDELLTFSYISLFSKFKTIYNYSGVSFLKSKLVANESLLINLLKCIVEYLFNSVPHHKIWPRQLN